MKAVLLLHGFLTDYRDFGELVPRLREEYDYVCQYVFPGHLGINGEPINYKEFTVEKTFDSVNKVMSELTEKYDIIDVIGFSMGGAVATYLSTKYQFRNLILLSPANKYLNFSLPINRAFYFVKSVIERMTSRKLTKEDRRKIDKELGNVRMDDVKSVNMALRSLIPNYSFHTLSTFIRIIDQCNKNLQVINNPTLIIWGELDQLVPRKSVYSIYKLVQNEKKKMVIYRDISHLMLGSKNANKIINEVMLFLRADSVIESAVNTH